MFPQIFKFPPPHSPLPPFFFVLCLLLKFPYEQKLPHSRPEASTASSLSFASLNLVADEPPLPIRSWKEDARSQPRHDFVKIRPWEEDRRPVKLSSYAKLRYPKRNPLLVLDCCSAVSRGRRWRFGNMAGVFQVMTFGVRALDKKDLDPSFKLSLQRLPRPR
ncbi:hypothetical protein L484_027855 [Morus notabilis]|uniref:Uncharacterized protein n=1 Tax=Morus notabilis TaxID=981085 RepID=W9S790_9ROSA|nr:hypothetical protein L484_027855 [Morus notabilis]